VDAVIIIIIIVILYYHHYQYFYLSIHSFIHLCIYFIFYCYYSFCMLRYIDPAGYGSTETARTRPQGLCRQSGVVTLNHRERHVKIFGWAKSAAGGRLAYDRRSTIDLAYN